MRAWLLAILAAGFLAACGSANAAPPKTTIELGTDDSAIYLVTNDLDPSRWPVDANFHSGNLDPSSFPDNVDFEKVSTLPNGVAQICKYTTSYGVTYTVWATDPGYSTSSAISARALCRLNGQ